MGEAAATPAPAGVAAARHAQYSDSHCTACAREAGGAGRSASVRLAHSGNSGGGPRWLFIISYPHSARMGHAAGRQGSVQMPCAAEEAATAAGVKLPYAQHVAVKTKVEFAAKGQGCGAEVEFKEA